MENDNLRPFEMENGLIKQRAIEILNDCRQVAGYTKAKATAILMVNMLEKQYMRLFKTDFSSNEDYKISELKYDHSIASFDKLRKAINDF